MSNKFSCVCVLSHLHCLDVSKLGSKMKRNISSVWHATVWTSITLNNQHLCDSSVVMLTRKLQGSVAVSVSRRHCSSLLYQSIHYVCHASCTG